jgi:D-amino peptidase
MEGIGGVSTWEVQADTKGREYEKFRHLMTQEVNAAIAGAFDAGATEVLIAVVINWQLAGDRPGRE